MLDRDKQNIQKQINSLSERDFNADKIQLLLINIRDYITNKKSHLKELCHFVAHSKRDRGISYEQTLKKINTMFKIMKKGGKWNISPIFDKDKIFDELILFFDKYKFVYNEIRLLANKDLFFISLYQFLDKVEIDIKHNDIEKIVFSYWIDKNGKDEISFVVIHNKDISGIVNLKKNVSIGLPLF